MFLPKSHWPVSPVAVLIVGNVNQSADCNNHVIRKMSLSDFSVLTVAGRVGVAGHADGAGDAALFTNPSDVAVAADGSIIVADNGNHCIRRIVLPPSTTATTSPAAAQVSTIAGTAARDGFCDSASRPSSASSSAFAKGAAAFFFPNALSLGKDGCVLVVRGGAFSPTPVNSSLCAASAAFNLLRKRNSPLPPFPL